MDNLYTEAVRRFQELLSEAERLESGEPTAMTLATVGKNNAPSVRTVLLKEADERGFVFFTNLTSRKGKELRSNPHVALCFFWRSLDEQVIIEGKVVAVSDAEADDYWGTRPRESQIGAWASMQSQPLENREKLERRVAEVEKKYANSAVPRPAHWSGFRVKPHRIEFWKRGAYRLHQRIVYTKAPRGWKSKLLYP